MSDDSFEMGIRQAQIDGYILVPVSKRKFIIGEISYIGYGDGTVMPYVRLSDFNEKYTWLKGLDAMRTLVAARRYRRAKDEHKRKEQSLP